MQEAETAMIDIDNTANQIPNKSKICKNHQNMEKRLNQTLEDNDASDASENGKEPSVFEVEVEVNVVELNFMTFKQNSTSPKRRPKRPPPKNSNCIGEFDLPKSDLVSTPSEISIISAAAVEELHHLRSYYSKQLRRINYISHEHLQSSQPGMLTCMREPFKSLRLPSKTTIARGARNLWTRVSMRRKLIE